MQQYLNLGGRSGIAAYTIGEDFITVKFSDTARTYTYSYQRAGRAHVEAMKILANAGQGLNTYITRHVKELYD